MTATGPMVRALIVDDEEPARRVVREYLSDHPDIQIAAECANGFAAVKAAAELKPDLIFLDIQMPKLDGFEVLELLEAPVETIFITAHDEHALHAFSVHAVDYLLKPFTPERFGEALARARERIGHARPVAGGSGPSGPEARKVPSSGSISGRALSAAARGPGRYAERILVRDGAKVHVISAGSIDFIQAQDDYINVRSGGRDHLKQQALAEVEESLDPARFVRVHRSYILNVERLARIELYAKDSRIAILKDGSQIPVSRTGYQRLRELL